MKINDRFIEKEKARLLLTQFAVDVVQLKRGDDSDKLINDYLEEIMLIFTKDKSSCMPN